MAKDRILAAMAGQLCSIRNPELKRLSLPDTSAEEFGQRGNLSRIVHLVAPVARGDSKITVNGQVVHDGAVTPGMLRLCNPTDEEQRSIRKPVEVMVFTLPFKQFEVFCEDHPCPLNASNQQIAECRPVKHRLVQQLTSTAMVSDELAPNARPAFIAGITAALVGVLLDHYRKQSEIWQTEIQRGLSTHQLRECISFADQNLGRKICIADWASVTRLSASEFGRRFQASTKLTPYAWYINRRIERAQELLQKRSTVISDLTFALGFSSQSHFTEAFRRRTGMSPARWRSLRKDFDSVAVS